MKTILYTTIFAVALCVLSVSTGNAQQVPNPRVSPTMISAIDFEGKYIKVVYGMPFKRDRTIFGELVPFGQVWRTGANEATEITFTGDVTMGGVNVPAGHYSLFTIPEKDQWTIILNKDLGLWGSFRYNKDSDLVRFTVPTETLDEEWEAFRILLAENEGSLTMKMRWDKTGVTIPITVR